MVREVMAAQLADEGYQVTECGDGTAALAVLDRQGPFDILVCDLAMPGLDGWLGADPGGAAPTAWTSRHPGHWLRRGCRTACSRHRDRWHLHPAAQANLSNPAPRPGCGTAQQTIRPARTNISR